MNKNQGVDLKLDIHKFLQDQQTSSDFYSKPSKLQESSITRDIRLSRLDGDKIDDLRSCIKTSLNRLNLKEGMKITPSRSTPLHYDTSRSTSVENSIRNREIDHQHETLAMKVQDLELENRLLHTAIHKRDDRISKLEEQVNTLASTIQNHQHILNQLLQAPKPSNPEEAGRRSVFIDSSYNLTLSDEIRPIESVELSGLEYYISPIQSVNQSPKHKSFMRSEDDYIKLMDDSEQLLHNITSHSERFAKLNLQIAEAMHNSRKLLNSPIKMHKQRRSNEIYHKSFDSGSLVGDNKYNM